MYWQESLRSCILRVMVALHHTDGGAHANVSVTCRFFARYAELVGLDEMPLALPAGATVADAVRLLRARVPNGDALPERPLAAVNRAHALPSHVLSDGDELALLPPLAGG